MKALLIALLFLHPPFEWRADHKLQWSDFEGAYNGDKVSAETCSGIEMEETKDSSGGVVFHVNAMFHPELSFISPICSMSKYALGHEQLHFDITELYARQLRHVLAPLQHTHKQADVQVAGDMYDVVKQAWEQEEMEYDAETNHSINSTAQVRWRTKISLQLTKLRDYANKSSP